jgi:hypothetical protein
MEAGKAGCPVSNAPTAAPRRLGATATPGGTMAALRLGGLELRGYQRRIAAAAVERNTIAMLPTGSGKTLIAAEAVRLLGTKKRALLGAPSRALFFVPTVMLVAQQAKVIREWTGLRVCEYFGGQNLDVEFEVLVTTPKAFETAQARDTALAWRSFRLVVFDEVHHVLKLHPYRTLAAGLRGAVSRLGPGSAPRVLGLSASLTYAATERGVEKAVLNLAEELCGATIVHASASEMEADGYTGARPPQAEVIPLEIAGGDARELGLVLPEQRKPHELLPAFLHRVKCGTATPFAAALFSAARTLEAACAVDGPQARGGRGAPFSSPIDGRSPAPLREWGELAHRLAADERLTTASRARFAQLEHYYEALRLLVVSWEAAPDAAATYLRMVGAHEAHARGAWPPAARRALDAF